jgi:hypothetical protein
LAILLVAVCTFVVGSCGRNGLPVRPSVGDTSGASGSVR